jgi:hypothetical protein
MVATLCQLYLLGACNESAGVLIMTHSDPSPSFVPPECADAVVPGNNYTTEKRQDLFGDILMTLPIQVRKGSTTTDLSEVAEKR